MAKIIAFPLINAQLGQQWFSGADFSFQSLSSAPIVRQAERTERIRAACEAVALASEDQAASILLSLELDLRQAAERETGS
jgi:hypothetical protein